MLGLVRRPEARQTACEKINLTGLMLWKKSGAKRKDWRGANAWAGNDDNAGKAHCEMRARVGKGCDMPPDDIGIHIAVKTTDSGYVQGRRADYNGARVQMDQAAHVPDHNLSGCGIFPKDVGRPVSVEITNFNDIPGRGESFHGLRA